MKKAGLFFSACGGVAVIAELAAFLSENQAEDYISKGLGFEYYIEIGLRLVVILLCISSFIFLRKQYIPGICMAVGMIICLLYAGLFEAPFLFLAYFLLIASIPVKAVHGDKKLNLVHTALIVSGFVSQVFGLLIILVGFIFLHENDDPNGAVSPESVNAIVHGLILFIAGLTGIIGATLAGRRDFASGALMAVASLMCIGAFCRDLGYLNLGVLSSIPFGIAGIRQLNLFSDSD